MNGLKDSEENFSRGFKSGYAKALKDVRKNLNELEEREQPAINIKVNGEELSIIAEMLGVADKPNSIASLKELIKDYPQYNLVAFSADMLEWAENNKKEVKGPVQMLRRWCMNAEKWDKERVRVNPSIMPSIGDLWDLDDD